MKNVVLKLHNIKKIYKVKDENILALDNINIDFELGKFYLIIGHSGSGKSTLLHLLGLIDSADSGEIIFNDNNISNLNSKELAKLRNEKIGYIFQEFYLDKYLKAYENIMVPMLINKNFSNKKEIFQRSLLLLDKVGLKKRKNHFPKQLSGGEQQRVCIARALANYPDIILADEPTGNLDINNEKYIFNLLKELASENKCVIMVSHSSDAKNYADVILEMDNGRLKRIWCY